MRPSDRVVSSTYRENGAEVGCDPDRGGDDIGTMDPPIEVGTRRTEIVQQDETARTHHGDRDFLTEDLARTRVAVEQIERAVSGELQRVAVQDGDAPVIREEFGHG